LSRGNEKCLGIKWLDINSININNCDCVVCYAEEELVIECGIDHAKKVRLPWLYLQLESICQVPCTQVKRGRKKAKKTEEGSVLS
jgi:hypothetical protein